MPRGAIAPPARRSTSSRPSGAVTSDSPVGVAHVLVNGAPIRQDGEAVPDARPGKVLRG